jgi:5-methyltetrahydrofolate--homocysteine methyltransferase
VEIPALEDTVEPVLQDIFNAILVGDASLTVENARLALEQKIDSALILASGMIAAMTEVGDRFERGDYFVPEMLVAARAMQAGLAVLKPHLQQSDVQSEGKVVIGTVKGDMHDIGKNLVSMMLEGAGFEIIDLGTDTPAAEFVRSVQDNEADLVAMSALLTTTMPQMENTINALLQAGLRDRVKVIVGGAPVTESYAIEIGADGYAKDASRAVKVAKSLL